MEEVAPRLEQRPSLAATAYGRDAGDTHTLSPPEAAPVWRILTHIGEPAEPPRIAPAHGPSTWDDPPVDLVPDWEALGQPSSEYVFDQEAQW